MYTKAAGHSPRRAKGFTLVELVVTIVILAAATAGILAAVLGGVARSVDPMIQTQAVIIAEAYLEEALLKAYDNPPGGYVCAVGEAPRNRFDDVLDYNCVDDSAGALDQNGNTLAGLSAYNVRMSVAGSAVNGQPTRRITVNVTHDGVGIDVQLVAHRTAY